MKASSFLSALVVVGLASVGSLAADEKKAPTAGETAKAKEKLVTPDEAEKLLKENPGVTVLDVRTPEEFAEGHIKGAVNADINGDDFEKKIAALDQSKPVLIHCQAGGRSSRAIEEMGGKVKFPQIYHLKSGFKGWKAAEKPVAK
jgi:rhodanese-related sulfurtransferase